MRELIPGTADREVVPTAREGSTRQKAHLRSSLFKYYIHDSVDHLRLQLLGELTEAELVELNGCWNTAKTTLGSRKLVVDVRGLKKTDYAGKQWLRGMAEEGAVCLPESYLRGGITQEPEPVNVKTGFFGKVAAIFRGSRVVPAASSTTQAP